MKKITQLIGEYVLMDAFFNALKLYAEKADQKNNTNRQITVTQTPPIKVNTEHKS